ncbi:MAG: 1-acyl-sn-glycerol-3-phosphate acyltransferase [Cyanobacteria bacterium CRU_2_1]|nr:1-acyl-sn-glycerol-3-phosphate acyltransferase [Cyanobacteria bacterium RU_5_0]NJR57683.1 1-acyl-sn-glycerol-3-phosphate acyltransferase [Cyanobacteria bacterium CRU_2_1]
MPISITEAQPPLKFIPPAFDPVVYRFTKLVLPAWLRWRVQLVEIQVSNPETLVNLYRQFQTGNIRFMMAFRHPSTNDPYCMFHLLSQCLPKVAKQQGVELAKPIHAHFIYDRGIPLWAGKPVGWLYSRLGCTPIRRGKVDLQGLRSARQLFVEGRFPMAAAPEGATNGHSEVVSPIESGIAQFGFWCVEDLRKAKRSEQVMIVPIGIQYHYATPPWQELDTLLSELEADAGLLLYPEDDSELGSFADQSQELLYKRLIRLSEHLLLQMEKFYTKFYHQNPQVPLAERSTSEATDLASPEMTQSSIAANQPLAERLHTLLNAALVVAEQHFGLPPKGSLTDRCRRLEQAGWDWIYREDLKHLEGLSLVERGLADRIAEEANLRLWHMRLVETFVSVTGHYVFEKPTVERFAETTLLLWDMVTRIKGKTPFPRPCLGAQRVQMTVGEPIAVSERWADYKANRRQAVAVLTHDLQLALENMIF